MTIEGFKRKLTAILSADVVDYSRLMDQNEEHTIRTLISYRTAISDVVQQYRGRVVDTPGDNILAEYGSMVDAVKSAVNTCSDSSVTARSRLPWIFIVTGFRGGAGAVWKRPWAGKKLYQIVYENRI